MEDLSLLRDLAVALIVALLAGALMVRLRMPVLVGYLLGGLAVGPYGLAIVTNQESIARLASIGLTMMMFALGVEFSLTQFRAIRRLVVVGGSLFVVTISALATAVLASLGLPFLQALLLGFIVSLSSTILVARLLLERQDLEPLPGKTMLGWLILQDLAVVPMLVMLPFLSGPTPELIGWPLAIAALKMAAFVAFMYGLGPRIFPRMLRLFASLRHKEVLLLAVIGLCFGAAALSSAFGLSIALGAFLAGLVLSEADERRLVLPEVLPMRDLFVTLFFVSLGMVIDPAGVARHPVMLLALVVAVIALKGVIGFVVAAGCGAGWRDASLIGLGLAQVGEFALVLAREGQVRGVLPVSVMSTVLSIALLSMVAAPFMFKLASPVGRLLGAASGEPSPARLDGTCGLRSHVVVANFGRRGEVLTRFLEERGVSVLVVDRDRQLLGRLGGEGVTTVYGDLTAPNALEHADLGCARLLVFRPLDIETAIQTMAMARAANPTIKIIVSTERPEEVQRLREAGANEVLHPGFITGLALLHSSLLQLQWPTHEIHGYLAELHQSGIAESLDHLEETEAVEAADAGSLWQSR